MNSANNLRCLASAMLCVGLLTACSSPPRSIDALRANQSEVTTICSSKSADEVIAALSHAWSRCFVEPPAGARVQMAGNIPVVVGGGSKVPYLGVYEVPSQSGRSLIVRSTSGVMMMVADLTSNAACMTVVSVRGWDDSWSRRAANTERWISDPTHPGPSAPVMLGGCSSN